MSGLENAIVVKDLCKSYPGFSLRDVSFSLPAGSILGLVGENGAGKSTTIKLLMDAIHPDAGTIQVLGTDTRDPAFSRLKEKVGVVLDEAYFPEVLTAQNVEQVMKNTYTNWNGETYHRYLEKFRLPDNKVFKNFSRGMRMKLAIAVALSHDPELLVLDEATGGLDPMVREEILDIFNEFTREESHSILLSSHIVSDLEKVCDYIAFLHNGRLLFCEEKDRLLEEYAIVRLRRSELEALESTAVVGKKVTDYGAEVLVKRGGVPASFAREHLTLEDIILFLAKGEDNA